MIFFGFIKIQKKLTHSQLFFQKRTSDPIEPQAVLIRFDAFDVAYFSPSFHKRQRTTFLKFLKYPPAAGPSVMPAIFLGQLISYLTSIAFIVYLLASSKWKGWRHS